jgi:predicted CXXCH cytochrome family protein
MNRFLPLVLIVTFISTPLTARPEKEGVHTDCLQCHKEKDSKELNSKVDDLCLKCHPLSTRRDHPINVKPQIRPQSLPLDEEGRINCITCHEPHGRKTVDKLLRMEFNTLCQECHKMR